MRNDAQRAKGHGSGFAYYPEQCPENLEASHAQVKEPRSKSARSLRRQQARWPIDHTARRRAEVVPLSQADQLLLAAVKVFRVRDA